MKEENRAYATQINMLFVSQGSRARGLIERPRPHSNGLKPSAPPHSVASSRNKAVCAFRLVPRPRGCGCDGSLPSTKRIIAASRHFARRVASRESPSPRRLTRGFWRRAVAASAHWFRRRSTVAVVMGSFRHAVILLHRYGAATTTPRTCARPRVPQNGPRHLHRGARRPPLHSSSAQIRRCYHDSTAVPPALN